MKSIILFTFVLMCDVFFAQNIAAGAYHSVAICKDGKVMTWGGNYYGELGEGSAAALQTNVNNNLPRNVSPVNGINGIAAVAAGRYYSMALQNNGSVWTWGVNANGEIGNGTNADSNVPIKILTGVTAIAGGDLHLLALKSDSTVWAWGFNDHGQIGNGTTADSNVPVQVSNLSGIIAIAGGERYSLALKNDGSVWAWGLNSQGQLGNGTNIDSSTPVMVSAITGITAIAGGNGHSLALTNYGALYSWGGNYYGQLGNGSNVDSNVPVQVSSLTGITAIATGAYLAIKSDSTVWTWGENSFYRYGNTTSSSSNVPVRLDSLKGIKEISGGFYHSLALKNNGTLFSRGDNWDGEVGNPNYYPNSNGSIVQVVGLCTSSATQIKDISRETNVVVVFPNPTSGIFNVMFKHKFNAAKLCVYDLFGNCVWSINCHNDLSQEIDLTSHLKGIYFLEVESGGERDVKKIVVE